MKKNDVLQIPIDDIGVHGEGIGHAGGMAFFVQGAVPGDTVTASVTKAKKTYAYARVLSVDTPSPDRTEMRCPAAGRCGGCQIEALSYPAQLRWKEDHVHDLLRRVGGFSEEELSRAAEPILGMEEPWRYRNKAQVPVGIDAAGHIVTGYYAKHSHRIVPSRDCLIGAPENGRILDAVVQWMEKNHIRPYDEETGQGLLRHILIRKGLHTGEIMVCLVAASGKIPDREGLLRLLHTAIGDDADIAAGTGPDRIPGGTGTGHRTDAPDSAGRPETAYPAPHLTSLMLNVNRTRGNVILGDRTICLAGEDTIEDTIGGVAFRISARSFYQVNPVQMERLYQKALSYADLHGLEEVCDLYCGIGTISLFLARQAGHVTGVEIVPDAVRDAKRNARLNGIGNAEFFCGAVEDVLPRVMESRGGRMDTVVLDPPRKGCEPSVIDTIRAAAPDRVVYVSCDPATLARDLALFCADGMYRLERYCPVDQFCQCVGIETAVLLRRT